MVAEGQDPNEPCNLCTTPFKDHTGRRHGFSSVTAMDSGSAIPAQQKKKDQPQSMAPKLMIMPQPDIVLREALIRCGVISRVEIAEVERELTGRETARIFADPSSDS